jgi:hypothetical protein
MKLQLRRFCTLFRSFLREISDENGYARYLELTGKTHSGKEWRAYIDRRHNRKFKNAKCC